MKRLISVFTLICIIMTFGCFSASAADEASGEELSASNCSSGIVIGDSLDVTVVDADETEFSTHDENDSDLGITPRVTVPNGCVSCIKRIVVWPAHYNSSDKTIRYNKDLYAFYTWAEATEFGGTLGVPTSDTRALMQEFLNRTTYIANAWRMEVTFNIYSDYYGSHPDYYDFIPSSNCLANRTADGTVRFECNGKPGHQSVYLTANFSAPESFSNQPALVLDGGFFYFDKTTNTKQGAMSFAQTLFNQ